MHPVHWTYWAYQLRPPMSAIQESLAEYSFPSILLMLCVMLLAPTVWPVDMHVYNKILQKGTHCLRLSWIRAMPATGWYHCRVEHFLKDIYRHVSIITYSQSISIRYVVIKGLDCLVLSYDTRSETVTCTVLTLYLHKIIVQFYVME